MTEVQTQLRTESDLIGAVELPADVYYGVNTVRAAENFQLSSTRVEQFPELIEALAIIKHAAAAANRDVGALDETIASAIIAAAKDVAGGQLHDQFILDMIQGGAGTSTNMNANEVIANRGLEHLGLAKGDYDALHPLNHVNMGQSTNDVYPTALKLALHKMTGTLLESIQVLKDALRAKAAEFHATVKMGRTQMQIAVPMTLGQEFAAWAVMLERAENGLKRVRLDLLELNLGGTAIGTGINANPNYRQRAIEYLREITGLTNISSAPDLIAATADTQIFVDLSGALKRVGLIMSKIANDLRLLSSGPSGGFGEINLPARQAGSSIMPGKVNPVIAEAVNQVAYQVAGHDAAISMAVEAGQLELNPFEPVMARGLFDSIGLLSNAATMFADKCIVGITANEQLMRNVVEGSAGLATVFSPVIGYKAATALAVEATKTGAKVTDLAVEKGLLTSAQVEELITEALAV
ncbi:MAG TPA: aspartate ammonia-lyase [Enteractinococcus helveticum]|uniref:Aspartate ammonia-lyase n=1 Tax=Enteractinococcus helveticum TaxID=1837282 RepID=A0A921K7D8_9MICC|nr:aspartate ammonia-lyase [Enteractinococcus helveticum]HJF14031.1 aspartate ammonia-lyase [Enteractinococcus helveticum]